MRNNMHFPANSVPPDRSTCCEATACALEGLRQRQAGTLKAVLAINVVMFVVEVTAGLLASSSALLSDSLDNLGDALTYAASLYVVASTNVAKARVAIFKGLLIMGAGLFVVGQLVHRILLPTTPMFETMGVVGMLALAANAVCLGLLWKHRHEDVNMTSVWECSRNDIASNCAVLVAAAGVWLLGTGWPDLVVAGTLAALFLWSATKVLRRAFSELRRERQASRPRSPAVPIA